MGAMQIHSNRVKVKIILIWAILIGGGAGCLRTRLESPGVCKINGHFQRA